MATDTTKKTAGRKPAAKKETAAETAEQAATEKMYSQAEVNELFAGLKAQMAALQAQINESKSAAPSVSVNVPDKERVTFRWQAPVADDNVLEVGEGGRYASITGRQGTFFVPKDELHRVLTPMLRSFLADRWLIVLDGLDEEEREALGVNYKQGEVIDAAAFMRLIDLGRELLDIYPALCAGNRLIVAKMLYESWTNDGYAHVKRDVVKGLEDFCSVNQPEEKTFQTILQEMNAKEAERR